MKKILPLAFFTLFSLPLSSQEKGLDQRIDEAFQPISDFFSSVIFFSIGENPFVIYLLVGSAIFFTLYFGFPNIKYFMTSIRVVSGKYDKVEKDDSSSDDGEVSHFQALTTAVSGTVGNGNIAGVALAIALGGPGATFWMIVCGLMGMSLKFVEINKKLPSKSKKIKDANEKELGLWMSRQISNYNKNKLQKLIIANRESNNKTSNQLQKIEQIAKGGAAEPDPALCKKHPEAC